MTDSPKSTFAQRGRAAKPHAKKYDVWDDVISGLGLRVGISGHRSFFLRRSVRGRIRSATIGSADAMSVPATRACSHDHRRGRRRVIRGGDIEVYRPMAYIETHGFRVGRGQERCLFRPSRL